MVFRKKIVDLTTQDKSHVKNPNDFFGLPVPPVSMLA